MIRLGQATRSLQFPEFALNFRHSLMGEQRGIEACDVAAQTRAKHIGWQWRFEFTFSDKEHDGVKEPSLQFQELSEAFDVAEILAKRILKPVLVAVDALTPGAVLLIAQNPSLHVLRLDNENAKSRNQNMIKLGRAVL